MGTQGTRKNTDAALSSRVPAFRALPWIPAPSSSPVVFPARDVSATSAGIPLGAGDCREQGAYVQDQPDCAAGRDRGGGKPR